MSFKASLGLVFGVLVIVIGILLSSGFRFWWASDPDPSMVPPPVVGTIADPNPPQPVVTCVSYGLRQTAFGIDLPFKQNCQTVYK